MQAVCPTITGSVLCAASNIPRLCSSSAHARVSWEEQPVSQLHALWTTQHSFAVSYGEIELSSARRALVCLFKLRMWLGPVLLLSSMVWLLSTCYGRLESSRLCSLWLLPSNASPGPLLVRGRMCDPDWKERLSRSLWKAELQWWSSSSSVCLSTPAIYLAAIMSCMFRSVCDQAPLQWTCPEQHLLYTHFSAVWWYFRGTLLGISLWM